MKVFLKANVASAAASFLDYLVTIMLKELVHMDAFLAGVTGTIAGGVFNFFISRHWVFKSKAASVYYQSKRFLLTWTGNLLLNVSGMYILIKLAGVNYIIAKVLTSVIVAIAYNYPVQKRYVFKK